MLWRTRSISLTIQLLPFPFMKPAKPSSRHILPRAVYQSALHLRMDEGPARPLNIGNLYSFRPTLCIWYRIFNRSVCHVNICFLTGYPSSSPNGDTTVLDTAPAIPPAMKEATTGCEMKCVVPFKRDGLAMSMVEALDAVLVLEEFGGDGVSSSELRLIASSSEIRLRLGPPGCCVGLSTRAGWTHGCELWFVAGHACA